MLACAFCGDIETILIHAAPGMPPDYGWVTGCVLLILVLAATIDAFTAIVPDLLILSGLLAVTGMQWAMVSVDVAAMHLQQALMAGFVIWAINFAWYRAFKHDALGMGDAKWTMLAVACFGVAPGLWAWGLGAILAVLFIGAARLAHYRVTRVTFAPFLFIGLVAGLYFLRFTA